MDLDRMDIPPDIQVQVFPNASLPVSEFLHITLPSILASCSRRANEYLSIANPTMTDVNTIISLPIPPKAVVLQLNSLLDPVYHQSISYPLPLSTDVIQLPLWILTYWNGAHEMDATRSRWKIAENGLQELEPTSPSLVRQVHEALRHVPWSGQLHGFKLSTSTDTLVKYTTDKWLGDEHETQMLELLEQELGEGQRQVVVADVFFVAMLRRAKKDPESYLEARDYQWLYKLGQSFVKGDHEHLATITNVGGNHWVGLIIDFKKEEILYGDSMGDVLGAELRLILNWWTYLHTGHQFRHRRLPTSLQNDGHSCGILSWNALRAYLIPEHRLLDPKLAREERLNVMLAVIQRHQEKTFAAVSKGFKFTFTQSYRGYESDSSVESIPNESASLRSKSPASVPSSQSSSYTCSSDSEHSSSDDDKPERQGVNGQSQKQMNYDLPDLEDDDNALPHGIMPSLAFGRPTTPTAPANTKRTYEEQHQGTTPPASPQKKRKRLAITSSIRKALDHIKDKPGNGLLQWFNQKGSEETQKRYWAKVHEEAESKRENEEYHEKQVKQKKKDKEREQNKLRKRKQRNLKKEAEIDAGVRSPRGTKRRIIEMNLVDSGRPAKKMAEITRPVREIGQKVKEKMRKPQGRKKKISVRPPKYTNWQTPLIWMHIERAVKEVGWQMEATAIVNALKRRDPDTFANLNRTTVNNWIDRSGSKPKWTAAVQSRLDENRGNYPGHNKGGRQGIFANFPDVEEKIKKELTALRETGAGLTLITIRGVILARIISTKPEILQARFRDSSMFKASESFVRQWVHRTMGWTLRKATQAAHKKPKDWEDKCEESTFRKAYLIKELDISDAAFLVNADQTQVVYAPGNRMSYAMKGAKDVSVIGMDEKRAFTLMVSVAADGTVLPFQAIYAGLSDRSIPTKKAPCYNEAINAGFRFEFSGTKTYWSNQKMMQSYVNHILAPYFEEAKKRLKRPPTQKTIWQLDVWAVHRSEEFRAWMKANHPTIILDYVPGGCTGIHQPCDVGIQRLLKLSIRRSYHEDIVKHLVDQMDDGTQDITIDSRLGTVRNWSVRWLWNAYQAINNPKIVKKAFEKCVVREWNLSWDCLAGYKIREKLLELKEENTEFWKELTSSRTPIDQPQDGSEFAEDIEVGIEGEDADFDDSDVPLDILVE